MNIRNITIIAHVDHGKTTLVDCLLRQTGSVGQRDERDRMMDNMDIERERGITIRSKNTSIRYKESKINIIDTPGHADFGGEVERVLSMADTSLLLVDAVEGPMPQTRFVLDKSLQLGHHPILVINKIDREFAEPYAVLDAVFELFDELGATHDQLDFPVLYASAKTGYASRELERAGKEDNDLLPLLDAVLEWVPPVPSNNEPLQLQIMNLDYSEYVGRLGIGRIFRGGIQRGMTISRLGANGLRSEHRISGLYSFEGLSRTEVDQAHTGDIIALSGISELGIGDTICVVGHEEARSPILVDEPTVSMFFSVNDSPFAGREGRYVTTRQLRERLLRETMTNVSLRVIEDEQSRERFEVQGRGDLHLSVLVETMRREGYELQLSKPEVIFRIQDGKKMEPREQVVIDLPEKYSGSVINELNVRRGDMQKMYTSEHGTTRLEYVVPTRGLLGFRSFIMQEAHGSAALTARFLEYGPDAGLIPGRKNGVLISMMDGSTVAFGLWNLQDRGSLMLDPGVAVYAGMIIGECSREQDIEVNPCKEKKQTNIRAAAADEAVRLIPPRKMSLEQALDFIDEDELLEITPQNLRLRKRYLNPHERKRNAKNKLAKVAD